MEYEIDTEGDAIGTFGWTTPERYSSFTPALRRNGRIAREAERQALLIPESEELA